MNFKIISNIDEAEKAWKSLSPNEFLYDVWEFRYAYYKYFNYPLFFYAAYDNDEIVALLPLMKNTETNYLDFFAGFNYMESNRIFIKIGYDFLKQELFNHVKEPFDLNELSDEMKNIKNVVFQEYTYSLPLKGLTTVDDFVENIFTGNKSDFKKELLKINNLGVSSRLGNENDLEKMFEFNILRFGENSSFIKRPFWKEFHKDIAKLFDSYITVVEINKKSVAVGLSILFNNTFYGIGSSRNTDIANMGKYIILQKIEEAIEIKAENYNAGSGDFGWKEKFGFTRSPLYQLKSNA